MWLLEMILETIRKMKKVVHIIILETAAAITECVLSPPITGAVGFEPMSSGTVRLGRDREYKSRVGANVCGEPLVIFHV
jgi:hypothetical protein